MRDIKFRAWHVSTGKMEYNPLTIPGLHESDERINNFFTSTANRFQHLMQYTGRKTIDDKEVYDGDILCFFDNHDTKYIVKWDEDEGAWGIFYRENVNAFKIGMSRSMEVAGNIYDDPELVSPPDTNQANEEKGEV